MAEILFSREHSSGIEASKIFINSEPIQFINHKSLVDLGNHSEFEILWRMIGEPGATLTVNYTLNGITNKAIDESSIPSGRNRTEDYTIISL